MMNLLFRRCSLSLGAISLLIFPALCPGQAASTCSLERHSSGAGARDSFRLEPVMTGGYADVRLLERLRRAYSLRPAPSAAQALKTTARLAAQRSNPCAEALSAFALGRLTQAANVTESRQWFERAEKSFAAAQSPTGLAHVHFELAASVRNTKSSAEVASLFARVADEFERAGDARGALTARIHAVDRKRGDLQEVFGPLLKQAQQLGDPVIQAQIHHSWGDELFTRGHYSEAIGQYRLSDDLYVACQCQYDQRATLQTSLGRIERIQGRAEAAIPHYRLALFLQQKANDQYFIPQTLNAISVAYESMGQYQRAIAYVQQALSVAHAIHSQEFIDFLEANLGALYAKAGQPRRGLPLLQRATARLANDYQRCTRYQQLADLYVQLKQTGEAEQAITRSIDACERDQSLRSLADGLETRAKIRAGSGSLEDALADARCSLSLIEEISAHVVPEDAHRRGYNQDTLRTYETSIAILASLNRYSDALEITEQSRARAFIDLLSSTRTAAPLAAPVTPAPVTLARAGTRGAQPQPANSTTLVLESESHTAAIKLPEILSEVRRLHTTLLAYWVTDDMLYTWVVSADGSNESLHGISQAIPRSTIESLIRSTDPLTGAEPTQRAAWTRLYKILIAPVASYLPSVDGSLITIVPHGPLFRLSFAALRGPDRRYLVERHAISTIPAVGVLRYTQKNRATADAIAPHYTLLANPLPLPSPAGVPLPPLPGTSEEIAAIARTLPTGQTIRLEGSHANTAELAGELPQATVIHFATHAIVSGTDPFGSFLALSRSTAPPSDGLLTTPSIYGLRLRTQMVVLSACRTGRGPVSADGVAGLSRAFFYAGSASVLSTLWDVADQPTATMMPIFYQHLASGEPRAQALRAAQMEMIARLRKGTVRIADGRALPERPAYWAAFNLSGEP